MINQIAAMPAIYVINLDRSIDRLNRISRHLAEAGLSFKRLPAIDGSTVPDCETRTKAFRRCHGKEVLPAEVGCYLSHVKAALTMLDAGDEYAVIMEDDCVVAPSFARHVAALVRHDLLGLDMVRLQGRRSGLSIPIGRAEGTSVYSVLTRVSGSTCYIINRKAARAYVKELLPMCVPFDHAFDRQAHLGIKVGDVLPYPATYSGEGSTIGQNRNKLPRHKATALLWRAETEVCRFVFGLLAVFRGPALKRGGKGQGLVLRAGDKPQQS